MTYTKAFKKYCMYGNINKHRWTFIRLDYKTRGAATRILKTKYEQLAPRNRKSHIKPIKYYEQ